MAGECSKHGVIGVEIGVRTANMGRLTTMNEKTVKGLVDAAAVKKVIIVAEGAIKTWVMINGGALWVKNLGIARIQLVIDKWLSGQRGLNL
ncbi:MAG: hypothetical protein P1U35_11285 [Cycloclasticus sp.]|nr:hypothetical protein [Cycloclasticus sp.]